MYLDMYKSAVLLLKCLIVVKMLSMKCTLVLKVIHTQNGYNCIT